MRAVISLVIISILTLFFSPPILAQVPDAPTPAPTSFLASKVNRALVITEFSVRLTDAYTSHRNLNDPCHCFTETSSLFGENLTPVFKSSVGAYSFSVGVATGVTLISWWLWKRHRHPKVFHGIARLGLMEDSAFDADADVNNIHLWIEYGTP